MNIIIYGINGKMGKILVNCANEQPDITIIAGIDKYAADYIDSLIKIYESFSLYKNNLKPDCIIDFSSKDAIYDILPYATKNDIPVVLATTGYNAKDIEYIDNAAKIIPIFKSGNMSSGIAAMQKLIQIACETIGEISDIEIIETHHNQKIDAPSGTAIMLAESINSTLKGKKLTHGREGIVGKRKSEEIGMHSLRGGTVVGKHEVQFFLNNEVITIKHEAESKSIFAYGSLRAARFIVNKKPGIYSVQNI